MKNWLTDTLVRAVKTAAQALVALLAADQSGTVHSSFAACLAVAGMAALVCILHNIQSMPLGSSDDTADESAIQAATQAQGAPVSDAPNVPAPAPAPVVAAAPVTPAPAVAGVVPAADPNQIPAPTA